MVRRGGSNCDGTQEAMADEYNLYGYPQPDRGARQEPNCEDFEYNGSGSLYFSWSELNGHWQERNPHTRDGLILDWVMGEMSMVRRQVNGTLKSKLDALIRRAGSQPRPPDVFRMVWFIPSASAASPCSRAPSPTPSGAPPSGPASNGGQSPPSETKVDGHKKRGVRVG